jgi:polysaccharide deacetylase family protein (PEP-CTERM system associated)
VSRSQWDSVPCRIERNVEIVLDVLEQGQAKATFFTLGWVAERYPTLVRRIADAGHEIASHGYGHHRATDQSSAAFLSDIRLAKLLLQDISGQDVKGYRAPSFSIGKRNLWAFDCIVDAGYSYSSSVYPIRHDHYGMPEAPRFPFEPRPGLVELPVATSRVLTVNVPAGGGGYFRLLPYSVSRWLIRRVNVNDGRPAIFYFHPWELDPEQPRVPAIDAKARFRHYVNLHRTEPRLRRLVKDFTWDRADRVFGRELHA